jgi:hypothetical protein
MIVLIICRGLLVVLLSTCILDFPFLTFWPGKAIFLPF